MDVNPTDPRATPVDDFIAEALLALDAGGPEAYVERGREMSQGQRIDTGVRTEAGWPATVCTQDGDLRRSTDVLMAVLYTQM